MHLFLTLLLCGCFGFSDGAAKPDWNPAQTHVVIAGVLKWENSALAGFSERNRKDKELADLLLKLGVAEKNLTLLLDAQATRQKILAALTAQAKAAPVGATLLFYYCGHGTKEQGGIALANYDYRSGNTLPVREIGELIASHFQGQRVIFLADCCHSGGLQTAGEILAQKGKEVLVLTSADSCNVSTGNWTFTQAILDTLRGEPLTDHNHDGVITLHELAEEVALAMRYRERQRHGYATFNLNGNYRVVLTDVSKPRPPKTQGKYAVGEYVLALDVGRMRPARIIHRDAEKYTVEFYNYSDKSHATLPEERLQKFGTLKTYPAGTPLAVVWQRQPYLAKVVRVEKDCHLITYPGWSAAWDEWVFADRILGEYKLQEPPQVVRVERSGRQVPAVPLEEKDGKYYVRYSGEEENKNEWVAKERIKKPVTK